VRPTVTVVTVTYGDRWRQLCEVLDAVAALDGRDAISAIVVVDNGSGPQTKELLAQRPEVDVVTLAHNEGSATGFAAGIAAAIELESDFLWLLDDDNRPRHGALKEIMAAVDVHGAATAFQCMRESYEPLRRLAAGNPTQEVFGHHNGFLGESLRHRLGALKAIPRPGEAHPEMPWAMYGGFFASRRAFTEAGMPRTDYVMYADDTEYTFRVAAAGWPIRLLPEAVIDDIDDAWWTVAGDRRGVTSAVTPRVRGSRELRRMYYTVRNSVYFERRYRVTVPAEWLVNMMAKHVLMAAICVASAVRARSTAPLRALACYVRATWDGWRGRLGGYREEEAP
jgi:GT2 family glycosyltransferase